MKIKKLYDREGNVYTPLVSVDSVYDGDHSVKQLIEDSVKYPELYRTLSRYMTITINTSDWVGYTCRKTIPGMTSHMSVIVQPDSSSQTEYILNEVRSTSQGQDYLDFTCTTLPTTNLVVDVLGINSIPFVPVESLSITGNWSNPQYTESVVDYEGLTFTATYSDGSTEVVIPDSVNPNKWTNISGTQTATFYYLGVSATKTANVIDVKELPLTLEATDNGNISITKTGDPGTVYYSLNDGTQTELFSDTNIPVSTGDKVSLFRTLSNNLSDGDYFTINCTNDCYVYGNVMSLINKDNYSDLDTIEYTNAFRQLFFQNTYININESVCKLLLPATTLTNYCYYGMFAGCTSLTTPPKLPATTLADACYSYMFYGTSLTTAPELSATTLVYMCYYGMFAGCTSLTTAPELSATILADFCYFSMFVGCTSLTTAPELPAMTLVEGCYHSMFYQCTSLTTAPRLPATTLASNCYNSMFSQCSSLTTAPELSAMTLVDGCYRDMFAGCTSLTTAPELPAMTLANGCYQGMFSECTSLITAPELPATILAERCYDHMFSKCSSLTTAPRLPATTLANDCYISMFYQCTSLITAPELPATTLAESCYGYMFNGCSNLNEITSLATNISANNCTKYWVNGVSSTGTFYKDSSMTSWTIGESGIPLGWTIIDK